MKKLIIFAFLFGVIAETEAQSDIKVDMAKLVRLAEVSDFRGFVNYVHSLSFIVKDSSIDENGSLVYITVDKKAKGDILGCHLKQKKFLSLISYSTLDKSAYENSKKKLIDLGFKAGEKSARGLPETIESQDFEKGSILVSATMTKKSVVIYEFSLIRW
jgi:hypothetical protein